jgi:hypothetical protein
VEQIEKVQKKESTKVEFRKYVNNLKKKMKEGTISAKEYRELIMRWCKENSEG